MKKEKTHTQPPFSFHSLQRMTRVYKYGAGEGAFFSLAGVRFERGETWVVGEERKREILRGEMERSRENGERKGEERE